MSREASEKKPFAAETDREAGGNYAAGLVSVILPVKNAASYIRRTIGDLLAQTYPDIELIIAGPAEDDGTDAAVEEAVKEIPQERNLPVRYIGRPGEGVSCGRNAGIGEARGKYLVFFDGDDRIDPLAVETLVRGIQDADMASIGYDTYDGADADRISDVKPLYESPETVARTLSAPDFACRLFFQTNYQGYVWNKIFRADLIRKYRIRFREDLYYNEDRTFQIEYLIHASRVRMLPARLYHYLSNTGSAMDLYEEQQLNMEGLPPADDPLFERRITELTGFFYMQKALKKRGFSDARYFCRQVFADTLFSYFFEILTDDPDRADVFSRSALRRYARRLPRLIRKPDDEESLHYYRAFIRYGFTGRAYEAADEED